jgi:flagellar biosynthesis chaperone FliJ
MAVSRALRRLLNIRSIEEEQSRLALESALGELRRLEEALAAAFERDRLGRRLVEISARNGELPDRLAGLEETRAASRHAAALGPRIAEAELDVLGMREEFLSKRIERRQAETLIEETEAREALDAGRRGQQSLDDWYGNRMHRTEAEEVPAKRAARALAASVPSTQEGASSSGNLRGNSR